MEPADLCLQLQFAWEAFRALVPTIAIVAATMALTRATR